VAFFQSHLQEVRKIKDLHELSRFEDCLAHVYVERCVVEQDAKLIAIFDLNGKTPIPVANLSVLFLGPGTKISHQAMKNLADSGCIVFWTGEEGVRFYACGVGKGRSSRNLLLQAKLVSNPEARLKVVRKMYEKRFEEPLDTSLTLRQIRGKEGARMRDTYARQSSTTGVPWSGREYDPKKFDFSNPINRALTSANACLYGICHAAIVSAGYSPGLGFIHTGLQLSFVYDVADLYKTETAIPVSFKVVSEGDHEVERRVRIAMRDSFKATKLMGRIIADMKECLAVPDYISEIPETFDFDPQNLIWDPEEGVLSGGINYNSDL